ncbi:SDR family NAD(P)-dependent oxidoreductase [Actinoplanes couchii]|uniref:SDR family NAD(P)-dependent oxidoreductase n=1 Tax=Actinoplanes couchii TaxID=403638 RepID=UPI0019405EE9|nr:SDR family NAD(P)-dependent oxidoreductase [Actinoplanes couchii]MDR6319936.1 NAD(P)-dependent dehydrogenase (short-subunit alcohol dehydrogenase family) [Actinoplanes couchii]
MARILLTGSSAGIGRAAAVLLVGQGHEVVVHARDERRAAESAVPGAAGVVIGDLASLEQTRALAKQAAETGPFDAVVLNAGLARMTATERELTVDGIETTFQVNTLASYVLAALLPRPRRLVFTSSALAGSGKLDLDDPSYARRAFNGREAYSTTKLHLVLLALGLGRLWPGTDALAFDPGWVATAMTARSGDRAPLTPEHAGARLARLATGVTVPPNSYDTERAWTPGPAEHDTATQDALLRLCAAQTGVALPTAD